MYTDRAYVFQRVTFPEGAVATSGALEIKPLGVFADTNLFDYDWDKKAGTVKVAAFLAPNMQEDWEKEDGATVPERVKYVPPSIDDLPDVNDVVFDATPSSALAARTRLLRRAAPGSGGAKRRFGARTVPTAGRLSPPLRRTRPS